ncbi:tetratricopeptide repeat protein [Rhizobium oryzicola]|uniref:Tetratricopeptide repeat protein n=1 Tax=Rhizobium oryzicola TaxID=1232668 RepID=A0ABT8SXM8_9HYPH|nr:tetratricopeptide repeat protein [Rhizobium oryzicola]MDO1583215.1 tetratricopeptide repeat protein [Rhizobium oryzicola]
MSEESRHWAAELWLSVLYDTAPLPRLHYCSCHAENRQEPGMSILNSKYTNAGMMQGATEIAADFLKDILGQMELDHREQSILDLMQQGLSLGDILGIKKEHRDALINLAASLIQAGELDKARDVLVQTVQFDNLEDRALYLLGVVFQLKSDLERAAFFYLQFLALDATNPEGYLRLGECLMSAGELSEAREAIGAALSFAREGKGRPGNVEQAENLLIAIGAAGAAA